MYEDVFDQIVRMAVDALQVERVWLFGSRVRETARFNSDIDLAFLYPDARARAWGAFVADVEEQADTLLAFDLVDMRTCQPSLREKILRSGRVLYG